MTLIKKPTTKEIIKAIDNAFQDFWLRFASNYGIPEEKARIIFEMGFASGSEYVGSWFKS